MIEFTLNAIYVSFLCASIVFGLMFFVTCLASVVPHECWCQSQNGRFDMGALFCLVCMQDYVSRFISARTKKYLAIVLLIVTLAYILNVMINAHYTEDINLMDLMIVCLLCAVTKFVNQEYYDRCPEMDTTVLVIAGSAFFVVFAFYFRLSVHFVLVATVLCLVYMTICALERCIMWVIEDLFVNRRLESDSEHDTVEN